jgi:polysaccharide export outer membrane protein
MQFSKVISKRVIVIISVILTGCWLLSSCITYKDTNYLQQPGPDIAAYKDTVRYQDYKLQPGDRLSIVVHSLNPETNKLFQSGESGETNAGGTSDLFSYQIDNTGNVTFPYIGKIEAAQKTLRDIKLELEERAKPQFGNCYFCVLLVNGYFSVIGEGGTGRYNLVKEKLNIFEALAISGDLTPLGNRKKIKILRQTPTGTIIKSFDIRSKDILHSEFYYIQPNDVIYVQRIPAQFFGIDTWSALLGTITTTISIVLLGVSLSKYF